MKKLLPFLMLLLCITACSLAEEADPEHIHYGTCIDRTTCVACGYTSPDGTPFESFIHAYTYEMVDATTHHVFCSLCEEEYTESHVAVCPDLDTCAYCYATTAEGAEMVSVVGHDYQRQYNDARHWVACTKCGDVSEEASYHYEALGDPITVKMVLVAEDGEETVLNGPQNMFIRLEIENADENTVILFINPDGSITVTEAVWVEATDDAPGYWEVPYLGEGKYLPVVKK